MKILFVENHERFARLTAKHLLSTHALTITPSLKQAREVLAGHKFDVVLIDYDLDDGKGTELVREIKGKVSRPILIAISSHEAGNNALLDAGADAVCNKEKFTAIEFVIKETIGKVDYRNKDFQDAEAMT